MALRPGYNDTRITAASVSATQRLLSRMGDVPAPTAKSPTAPATVPTRAPRRARAADAALDTEALIRGVVAKIQAGGNAEAERLRDTVRKAIAMLQAAVG